MLTGYDHINFNQRFVADVIPISSSIKTSALSDSANLAC